MGFGTVSLASYISTHNSRSPWLPTASGVSSARISSGGIFAKSPCRAVAVQVELQGKLCEAGFSIYGFQGLKPGAFKIWVSWIEL
jgi:hypothetical protein